MIEINEKINGLITKSISPIFSNRVDNKILSLISIIVSIVTFFLIVSKLYVYASIFVIVSIILSVVNIDQSKNNKEFVLTLVSNLCKFIIFTLAVLTVILNLELHKIALFFIIYLLFIGTVSFVSKEYIKSLFNKKQIKKTSPSVLLDIILAICLMLAIMPFLNNSVIVFYILVSSILNTYLLVSDVLILVHKENEEVQEEVKENISEDNEDEYLKGIF